MDKIAPHFEKGGKFQALYPAYEAVDTALYTPGYTTAGPSHVRDGLDLKRIMITVWAMAFIPALVGCYVTGVYALEAMAEMGLTSIDDWRAVFLDVLIGYDASSVWDCFVFGLAYFIPLYAVVFLTGIAVEIWFASKRGHEVNEGFFVTSILFTLTLPATTPLWIAAVGIAFGVVIGKEVFGGTGKNFLNPALTGRAFLYFAYPAQMSGDAVWVAVDGYTRATALGQAALGEDYGVSWARRLLAPSRARSRKPPRWQFCCGGRAAADSSGLLADHGGLSDWSRCNVPAVQRHRFQQPDVRDDLAVAPGAGWLCLRSGFHGYRSGLCGDDPAGQVGLRHPDWRDVRADPGGQSGVSGRHDAGDPVRQPVRAADR